MKNNNNKIEFWCEALSLFFSSLNLRNIISLKTTKNVFIKLALPFYRISGDNSKTTRLQYLLFLNKRSLGLKRNRKEM